MVQSRLSAEGHPAICIDARHAKAALDMAPNKTDANDTHGFAHLAEVGFYCEVRVKDYDSMLVDTLVAADQIGQDHVRALQSDLRSHEDILAGRSPEPGRQVQRSPGGVGLGCAARASADRLGSLKG